MFSPIMVTMIAIALFPFVHLFIWFLSIPRTFTERKSTVVVASDKVSAARLPGLRSQLSHGVGGGAVEGLLNHSPPQFSYL